MCECEHGCGCKCTCECKYTCDPVQVRRDADPDIDTDADTDLRHTRRLTWTQILGTDTYVVVAKNIFGTVRFFLSFREMPAQLAGFQKFGALKNIQAHHFVQRIFRTNHATTLTYCTLGAPVPDRSRSVFRSVFTCLATSDNA